MVDRYRELVEGFYFEPSDSEIIGSFLQSDEEGAPAAASATSGGKNVWSKKSKKRKGVKSVLFLFSIVKSAPFKRSDKDTIVIDWIRS